MAASTSHPLPQNDSPSSSAKIPPKPDTETDDTQDACLPQKFLTFSVLCLHDFNPDDTGLLSFHKNEILDVIKRDESGWWAAIRQDGPGGPLIGWIPESYVSVLSEEMVMKVRRNLKKESSGIRDRVEYSSPTDRSPSPSATIEPDSLSQVRLFSNSVRVKFKFGL